MQCPKCGNEMEKGILQTNGSRIIWDTKKHRISVLPSEDGIELAFNFVISIIEDVYCCKACKTITFEYKGDKI